MFACADVTVSVCPCVYVGVCLCLHDCVCVYVSVTVCVDVWGQDDGKRQISVWARALVSLLLQLHPAEAIQPGGWEGAAREKKTSPDWKWTSA